MNTCKYIFEERIGSIWQPVFTIYMWTGIIQLNRDQYLKKQHICRGLRIITVVSIFERGSHNQYASITHRFCTCTTLIYLCHLSHLPYSINWYATLCTSVYNEDSGSVNCRNNYPFSVWWMCKKVFQRLIKNITMYLFSTKAVGASLIIVEIAYNWL